MRAWESWTQLLLALQPVDALDPALEADVADTLAKIAAQIAQLPLDYAALGPQFSEQIWQSQQLTEWLADAHLKNSCGVRVPANSRSPALMPPTPSAPPSANTAAWSSPAPHLLPKRSSRNPADSPSQLLRLSPSPPNLSPIAPFKSVTAHTPWRDGAYDVAVDARVDTTFQHRSSYFATTAATIASLQSAANGPVAVFFPSYAYAESVARELERAAPLRVAVQPRLHDLAAQTAWVEQSLAFTDALFLVLGSSFAESIDALGGRITHAMVVGPALPEVNAIQRARLAEFSALGREAAFRRVYQIPGMTKVNQALGRLVRAPGQRARVILHCRRFLEPAYASLLAHDYQFGANVLTDADLAAWLDVGRDRRIPPRIRQPAGSTIPLCKNVITSRVAGRP